MNVILEKDQYIQDMQSIQMMQKRQAVVLWRCRKAGRADSHAAPGCRNQSSPCCLTVLQLICVKMYRSKQT